MTIKEIALCSIAALLLGSAGSGQAQMASQAPHGKVQGPVAISALRSGTLVVLGGRGRLSLIESNSGKLTVLKDTLGYFSPVDMAVVRQGNTDSILIAVYNTVQRQGLLVRYSPTGDQVQTWLARSTFAGIAVDSVHNAVYIGDAVTGEVSSLSLGGN